MWRLCWSAWWRVSLSHRSLQGQIDALRADIRRLDAKFGSVSAELRKIGQRASDQLTLIQGKVSQTELDVRQLLRDIETERGRRWRS